MHYSEAILSAGNISSSKQFKYADFKTYENVSRSFFTIMAYYEELKYTLSVQRPKMELFDLISNVGGTFGLFLGMGLMSFIEVFEIILEVIFASTAKLKFSFKNSVKIFSSKSNRIRSN